MTELQSDFEKLKLDLKKLRILLIILTITELIYFIIIFGTGATWVNSTDKNTHSVIVGILSFIASGFFIWLFHIIVMGIIIWYNWKKMPLTRKKKIDNTLMILFSGIIGMWFWIPNKMELNNLIKKNTTHNTV
tara:strand:+ start:84 stop:482 length:399 start_codon:yes stop_codon:yes gene_type:complete